MATGVDAVDGESTQPLDYVSQLELAVRGRRKISSLPRLVADAVRIVHTAAPRLLRLVVVLAALQVSLTAAQVILAKRALEVLNTTSTGGFMSARMVLPLLLLAATGALSSSLGLVQAQRTRVLAELVQQHVQSTIIATCGAVELLSYDRTEFYNQLQRVQISATHRPVEIVSALIALVTGLATSLTLGIALLALSPVVLPLLLLAGVPVALLNRRASRSEFDFQVEQVEQSRERYYLNEVLTGRQAAKEVRAFTLGRSLATRWSTSNGRYVVALRSQVQRRELLGLISAAITAMAAAGAVLVLLLEVQHDRISVSAAGTAAIAARLLTGRLAGVVGGTGSLYESGLFLADYHAFMALGVPADIGVSESPVPAPPFAGVAAESVSFSYPGASRPVLEDVSVKLRPGEVIALVGENGSGKTTLAKILAGLYTPTSGRVMWGEADVRDLDREDLLQQVAVIFQDFVRYELPARENIGVGRAEAIDDLSEIMAAANQSGAHSFLSQLPSGYDTYLSQAFRGGQDLSIGQWQRVALARAFYRKAPFIILDEPSSALDPRAEAELFAHIKTLLAGRTVLLISHRFSTVRTADRIYVLKGGKIEEEGTHTSLMRRKGLYSELFTLQADGYKAQPRPSARRS